MEIASGLNSVVIHYVCVWVITGSVQKLLLNLDSGINLGGLREPFAMLWIEPRLTLCKVTSPSRISILLLVNYIFKRLEINAFITGSAGWGYIAHVANTCLV